MTPDRGVDENSQTAAGRTELERATQTARACIQAGIDAADPETVIPDSCTLEENRLTVRDTTGAQVTTLDLDAYSRLLVLGAGNAAGRAASAIEAVLGDRIDEGVVVTDAPADTEVIDQRPGDHPIPSQRGVESTRRLRSLADSADGDTLVICLITGGGSALMPAPAADVALDDLQTVTEGLLRAGAPIGDVNAVRKHLSDVKGGRLAATLAPGRVLTLVISDVVGTPLDVVAGGPTVPDSTTYRDALEVLDRYGIDAPAAVIDHLRAGLSGDHAETPDANHPGFDRTETVVVADNYTACDAARRTAETRGYDTTLLTTRATGPAREVARWHTAVAHEVAATGNPVEPPAVVVTGGEATVRVTGDGRGGPNHDVALAAALDLPRRTAFAAVDTDGIDGNSVSAGAIVDANTVSPGERQAAEAALDANDSHGFLVDRDAVVETGVTGTNVNDLRVLVVEDAPA